MSIPGLPFAIGLILANFWVQRASVSFCAALARLSGRSPEVQRSSSKGERMRSCGRALPYER